MTILPGTDVNQAIASVLSIRAMPTLNLGGIVLIGPLLTALGALSAYEPYVAVAGGVTFLAIAVASSEA